MSAADRQQPLRIDAANQCVWRGERRVDLTRKVFQVLHALRQRPNTMVTKHELLEAVWPGTYVGEGALAVAITQLRAALGDDRRSPRFIETVHGRGYRWIGPPEEVGGEPAVPGSRLTPQSPRPDCVGREAALAQLEQALERAGAGARQVVFVTGDPGIGKTALVDEFLGVAGQRARPPVLIAAGQCIESHGAGDLYRPWREAVEQLLRGGGEDTRELFRAHAPSWLLSLPEWSSPAQLDALRRRVTASTSEAVQRELERAIEGASTGRSIILVLEDLHWSDPATVTLLWGLAARREPAALLIIGTYRSADAIAHQHPITRLKRELSAKRQCIELALDGLASEAIAALLDRRFARHQLPGAFADRLHQQTSGNPLFVLNALADFVGRGWLHEDGGVWRCDVDLDAIAAAVPESTRDLIAFRLDQLPAATRELLDVAAVVGATFATQTVAAATERDCAEVEAALESVARAAAFLRRGAEIAWPDGTRGCEHEFRHALYRQVLLRGITPTRRQHLHRLIALALEGGYGDRVGEIAAALSVHHEQAGATLRAIDYLETLAEQAYERSAAHEAEAVLGHALALLKVAPKGPAQQERLLKVTIAHAIALAAVRGVDSVETRRAVEEARALGQSLPSTPEHITSLGGLVVTNILFGKLREARRLGEELLALGRADASPDALVTGHWAVGGALMFGGEIAPALVHLESAVAGVDLGSAEALRLDSAAYDPRVPACGLLGTALSVSGRVGRGRACVQAALRAARTKQAPIFELMILKAGMWEAIFRRDLSDARQLAGEAAGLEEPQGLTIGNDMSRIVLGWIDVLETRDPQLVQSLVERVGDFRPTEQQTVSRACALLAEAYLTVDRIADADAALEAAFFERREERFFDAELSRLQAQILLWAREGSARTPPAMKPSVCWRRRSPSPTHSARGCLACAPLSTCAAYGSRLAGAHRRSSVSRRRSPPSTGASTKPSCARQGPLSPASPQRRAVSRAEAPFERLGGASYAKIHESAPGRHDPRRLRRSLPRGGRRDADAGLGDLSILARHGPDDDQRGFHAPA